MNKIQNGLKDIKLSNKQYTNYNDSSGMETINFVKLNLNNLTLNKKNLYKNFTVDLDRSINKCQNALKDIKISNDEYKKKKEEMSSLRARIMRKTNEIRKQKEAEPKSVANDDNESDNDGFKIVGVKSRLAANFNAFKE